MLTQSIFWFSLWVIVCAVSTKLLSSHLFHNEENKILVWTSTTRDVKQRSLLSCAYLCMSTTGCCAASFASNSTCRIDMSETCNFTLKWSLGDTSILHKSGSTSLNENNEFSAKLNGTITTVEVTTMGGHGSIGNVLFLNDSTTQIHNATTSLQHSETTLHSYTSSSTQDGISTRNTIDGELTTIDDKLTSTDDKFTTRDGELTTKAGKLTTIDGKLTTTDGVIITTYDKMTTIDGELTTIDGEVITIDGELSTTDDEVTTTDGEVTTIDGELTTTDDELTKTHGELTTSDGEVTTTGDELIMIDGVLTTTNSVLTTATGTTTQGDASTEHSFTGTTTQDDFTTKHASTGTTTQRDAATEQSSTGTTTQGDSTTEQSSTGTTTQGDVTVSWHVGSSEYIYYLNPVTMMIAKEICALNGSKLVEIETPEEDTYLYNEKFFPEAQHNYWIGGYSDDGDDNYEWTSNPSMPMPYTNWDRNEPWRPDTQFCMTVAYISNYKWETAPCTDEYPFFCEKEL